MLTDRDFFLKLQAQNLARLCEGMKTPLEQRLLLHSTPSLRPTQQKTKGTPDMRSGTASRTLVCRGTALCQEGPL